MGDYCTSRTFSPTQIIPAKWGHLSPAHPTEAILPQRTSAQPMGDITTSDRGHSPPRTMPSHWGPFHKLFLPSLYLSINRRNTKATQTGCIQAKGGRGDTLNKIYTEWCPTSSLTCINPTIPRFWLKTHLSVDWGPSPKREGHMQTGVTLNTVCTHKTWTSSLLKSMHSVTIHTFHYKYNTGKQV